MKTVEDFVIELNKLINTHQISPKKAIKPLLISIKQQFDVKYKYIDIAEYDEELLKMLQTEKINFVKAQKFTIASLFRDLQKKCVDVIDLKNEYKITQSEFRYVQGYLMYFCCGSTYIDGSVREYFAKL